MLAPIGGHCSYFGRTRFPSAAGGAKEYHAFDCPL